MEKSGKLSATINRRNAYSKTVHSNGDRKGI